MSVEFVCDGCGKREPGTWVAGGEEYYSEEGCYKCGERYERLRFTDGEWKRPLVESGKSGGGNYWFSREDKHGQQHACSRECIAKAAEKMGVTKAVMPW